MKYKVGLKRYNTSIKKHFSEYQYFEINNNELVIKDYIDSKNKVEDTVDSKENSLTKTQFIIISMIFSFWGLVFCTFVYVLLSFIFAIIPSLISLLSFLFYAFLANPIFILPFAILSLYNLYKYAFNPYKINRSCGFFKLSDTLSFVEHKYYRFNFKPNYSNCYEYALSDISKLLCIQTNVSITDRDNTVYFRYKVKLVMESKKTVVDLCNIDVTEPSDNGLAKKISDFLRIECEVIRR